MVLSGDALWKGVFKPIIHSLESLRIIIIVIGRKNRKVTASERQTSGFGIYEH